MVHSCFAKVVVLCTWATGLLIGLHYLSQFDQHQPKIAGMAHSCCAKVVVLCVWATGLLIGLHYLSQFLIKIRPKIAAMAHSRFAKMIVLYTWATALFIGLRYCFSFCSKRVFAVEGKIAPQMVRSLGNEMARACTCTVARMCRFWDPFFSRQKNARSVTFSTVLEACAASFRCSP